MRSFGLFLVGLNIGSALYQILLGNYVIMAINVGAAVLLYPWGMKDEN